MCRPQNSSFSATKQRFLVFRSTHPTKTNTLEQFPSSFQPCDKFYGCVSEDLGLERHLHNCVLTCAQTTIRRSGCAKQRFKVKTVSANVQKRVFCGCSTRGRVAEHQQRTLSGGGRANRSFAHLCLRVHVFSDMLEIRSLKRAFSSDQHQNRLRSHL